MSLEQKTQIGGHRHRRVRWTFHSGQRQWHAPLRGACHCHSGEARDRLWRGGSRPPISSTQGPSPLVIVSLAGESPRLGSSPAPLFNVVESKRVLAKAINLSCQVTRSPSYLTPRQHEERAACERTRYASAGGALPHRSLLSMSGLDKVGGGPPRTSRRFGRRWSRDRAGPAA